MNSGNEDDIPAARLRERNSKRDLLNPGPKLRMEKTGS